jgi:hypothetical protein
VEQLQEVAIVIAGGLGLLVLASAALAVSTAALAWSSRFSKMAKAVDAELAPFGNTPVGQALHGFAEQLAAAVDEPDDVVIKRLAELQLIVRVANVLPSLAPQAASMSTAEKLAMAGRVVAGGLVDLLDGVPAGDENGKAVG